MGKHVLAEGNYLWHLFSWKLVPCLEGDAAREALPQEDCWQFFCECPPAALPRVRAMAWEDIAKLPEGVDWYLVDKDFTWTYAHPHEAGLGPYFYQPEAK